MDREWIKDGSKWKCKIGTYIVSYCTKWLLIKHLREVHGLMAKKARLKRLSTFQQSTPHQDHTKMNARILKDAMVMQSWNDQKVINCTHANPNMNGMNL